MEDSWKLLPGGQNLQLGEELQSALRKGLQEWAGTSFQGSELSITGVSPSIKANCKQKFCGKVSFRIYRSHVHISEFKMLCIIYMLSLYISCKAVLLYQRYFFLFIFFFYVTMAMSREVAKVFVQ